MPDSTDKSHQPILVDTDINTVTVIGRVIWHMNPDNIEKGVKELIVDGQSLGQTTVIPYDASKKQVSVTVQMG